ncbi:craniofacial development protein 2-like [Bolinopsis microptera]|uniref:craniofacial development protein 2-like n=1 Tax=Bolinopsis microptera TaxID=2820187 RepID=UPI0030794A6B
MTVGVFVGRIKVGRLLDRELQDEFVSSKSNPINYSKHSMYFGTWNVLSLVSSSSQLYQLSQNIDHYSLDILGITETHMPGSGKRVLTARLHGKHLNISVVVAYAPTDGADDGEKDRFYNVLSDTFGELPRHDLKLLLGDFNGKVTSNRYGFEGVIGGESLHSSSSDNGTRLMDFCAANQLVIGGTLFQHRDIHKGTWRSPNGLTSVAKITAKRHDVPAIEHLRNSSKVQEYNVALQNRFDCLANEVNLEDMWDNFKQTVTDVSMEVLGKRPRKVKEQHLSQTSKNLIEQRGMFKRRDPTSNVNRSAYSKLNKLVKKSCKIDDNNWATKIATDLEEASKKGQQREV